MALDDVLLQYGALGVMVVYLMWKDQQFSTKTQTVIDNNTAALNAFLEVQNQKKQE